ncbi:ribosome biogenesis GTPase A [Geomonas limicola]|uniref:Ribosome biogenesis GTPase A n=1 Tax=Geomonas limicola TaxID=2740186 RepID=A0A6V8N641_9BACT|nr:ribosome biogenesis GTPase YlqF [Geomonas limicola]GFO68026.1 ribosome biogenesis GTPase A [Geomonas limicola]
MTIRWYPGHMSKALESIADLIKKVDVVIEVLDARLPLSSSNHQLQALRRTKPWVKVLNKPDLADPAVTAAWLKQFKGESGVSALAISAKKQLEAKKLIKLCKQLSPKSGRPGFPVRVMVVGIPNVGKSTLINTLAGKSLAKVGDKPAITTVNQRIELDGIVLSDTPGVLWPDMDDQEGAYRLAASGAIGANALDYHMVALFAAEYLMRRYPELTKSRYKLVELPESPSALIEEIGSSLGCLIAGGEIDLNRASEAFLRELRAGKIGRISFEEPALNQESVSQT